MSKLALPDSRGGRSITLTFVAISWLVVTLAFARSWLDGPPMPVTDYGMAVLTILGIWLGREATEKLRG